MLIELKNIDIAHRDKTLISNVEFYVEEGEFVYIIGSVGSGKSSLLKTLYGELPITKSNSDEVISNILDVNLLTVKSKHLPELRRQLGIIFQDFQLLHDRTIGDNLDFVLRATGWKKKNERSQRIEEVLNLVELTDKKDKFPHELSGGEQQRISIARALLNKPRIILADEPTGNLDQNTGYKIVQILRNVCEQGTTVLMVTHNLNYLSRFPGIVYRIEGFSIKDVSNEYNTPIELD
ncbi:ATP-binding cassette domain-containing protein [uncultured Alloprevotella sp.]|jgi:cell division ATP-binding protein ftsE|uniref:cell division ATP-binding protein FtsE n=1 Tax=uncultured Alloprevotella sp. TaxID=1283315 RepID=UPI002889E8FC|nr:ATP-binding cassette domain-containing protein [uncultured Alloprevotella sp.]